MLGERIREEETKGAQENLDDEVDILDEIDIANEVRGARTGTIVTTQDKYNNQLKQLEQNDDERQTRQSGEKESTRLEEESRQIERNENDEPIEQDDRPKQHEAERLRRGRPMQGIMQEVRGREMERKADFTTPRSSQELLGDEGHFVDLKMTVTDAKDLGRTDFRFKLVEAEFSRLVEYFETNGRTPSGAKVNMGSFVYESTKPKDDDPRGILKDYRLCDAYVFERENEAGEKMTVRVAEPRTDEGADFADLLGVVRSAIGLVRIEAPREMSPEATEELLDRIMTEDFGVPDALEDVTAEAEQDYKIVEFAKRLNKSSNKLTDAERERALKLKRAEICPGYTDLMDEGRHFEIERRFGKFYLIHQMYIEDVNSIERVLKDGLKSSGCRFPDGATISGLSSEEDFHSGGADYVFMRLMSEEAMEALTAKATIVFKNELLDFMPTWYKSDQFGATDPETRKELLSTEEMLEHIENMREQGRRFPKTNEGMQLFGIGPQFIDQILVSSEWERGKVIEGLKEQGFTEFDGRAIEEVIGVMPSEALPGDEIAEGHEDDEADDMVTQADKEIEEMMKAGMFPQDDEFFGDGWETGGMGMIAALTGGLGGKMWGNGEGGDGFDWGGEAEGDWGSDAMTGGFDDEGWSDDVSPYDY